MVGCSCGPYERHERWLLVPMQCRASRRRRLWWRGKTRCRRRCGHSESDTPLRAIRVGLCDHEHDDVRGAACSHARARARALALTSDRDRPLPRKLCCDAPRPEAVLSIFGVIKLFLSQYFFRGMPTCHKQATKAKFVWTNSREHIAETIEEPYTIVVLLIRPM